MVEIVKHEITAEKTKIDVGEEIKFHGEVELAGEPGEGAEFIAYIFVDSEVVGKQHGSPVPWAKSFGYDFYIKFDEAGKYTVSSTGILITKDQYNLKNSNEITITVGEAEEGKPKSPWEEFMEFLKSMPWWAKVSLGLTGAGVVMIIIAELVRGD